MRLLVPAAAVASACVGFETGATAFQLREGSATALGAAVAGRSASDRDVSFSLYNPAALAGVKGLELSSGVTGLLIYGDARADVTLPGFRASDDPSRHAVIPSFTVGWRVSPDFVLGLAIDTPFGLVTEYKSDFVGAFDAVRSELTTITVTPQVAWRILPNFAIGAGVMVQYADAELQNRGPNGVQNVSGDGFDVGFTVGFQFEPVEGTRIGATVQSGFNHKLEGDYSGDFFPAVLAGAPVDASFDLPPVASLGLIQSITPAFRVMGEVEWTGWSAFDRITFTSTGRPTVVDVQSYEDSWLFSLGAEYDVDDRLTVRAGVARDLTPTRDAFRTPRVPDGDRWWLAAGASYEVTERIGLDAAYIYVDIASSGGNLPNTSRVAGRPVRASYSDGSVHLFAVNLRYAF